MADVPDHQILASRRGASSESATIAVSRRVRALRAAGVPVLDLGAGEPDFPTPAFVVEAAKAALDEGATRYTAVEGIAPLREAIAAWAASRHGAPVDANEVIVTTGSKQALFNACFTLFGEGDEVLLPTPSWTSYREMVALARASAVRVFGEREHSLKITAAALAAAATPRTRGLVLNSPVNPTGAVYARDELAAILALAESRGWWVIADEIYREIAYGEPASSLLDAAQGRSRDRLVIVDGVAKTFAMTGWRIGWAIAPAPLVAAMTALQSHVTSNATTVAQHAALAALTRREDMHAAVAPMVAEFRRRRDAALAILRAAGLDVIEPRGAFYLFFRPPAAWRLAADPGGDRGSVFAESLLEEGRVAVVPGAAFGTADWVRMSYAAAMADVVEGARRIAAHATRA